MYAHMYIYVSVNMNVYTYVYVHMYVRTYVIWHHIHTQRNSSFSSSHLYIIAQSLGLIVFPSYRMLYTEGLDLVLW